MIEYITDKLHKFNTSKAWTIFEYVVTICSILSLAVLIFSVFFLAFSPLSASAYSYAVTPYDVYFGNPYNVSYKSFDIDMIEGAIYHELGAYTLPNIIWEEAPINVTDDDPNDASITIEIFGSLIVELEGNIPPGQYVPSMQLTVIGDATQHNAPYFSPTYYEYYGRGFTEHGGVPDGLAFFVVFNVGNDFMLDDGQDIPTAINNTTTVVTLVLSPYDQSGETPIDCPTLQTQINQYNGSWNDFEGMLLGSTNEVIYQGYRNKLQEIYRQGENSVTLESLLAQYDGSFSQLLTLLSENNLRLLDEYNEIVQQRHQEGYDEGYYIGEENGYKNGYTSGRNKGQSDTFTKNFFTDFLGGVVEAIDSIHLYEHIREIDGGVSTVVEWYISPWTIFTSLICLIVVIIILKVWLGG